MLSRGLPCAISAILAVACTHSFHRNDTTGMFEEHEVFLVSDAADVHPFELSDRAPQMVSQQFDQLLECARRSPGCNIELRLFQEVAKIYRAPNEERPLVEFMFAMAKIANTKIWNGRLTWKLDSANNVLITIPATGEFTNRNFRPIAMQSHMDMVLAKADARPGEDLRPYFKANPIQLEEKDGWLRSKGEFTTLGADNGIGIAMQLRYLLDTKTPHPKLELVFTSGEEAGLVGAMKMKLPLDAAVMLNLDGLKLKEVVPPGDNGLMLIYGCQGARKFTVAGSLPGTQVARGADAIQLKIIRGLLGGHSGLTIHLDRVNTVKLAGQIFGELARQGLANLVLVNAAAGDPAFPNKVPTTLELVFTSDDRQALTKARRVIMDRVKMAITAARDEEKDLSKIEIEMRPMKLQNSTLGLSFSDFSRLGEAIEDAPNRIIHGDDKFPFKARTTSNIGSFLVTANPQMRVVDVSTVTQSRSYITSELRFEASRIAQTLLKFYPERAAEATIDMEYPPWMLEPSHWLIRLAQTKIPEFTSKSILPAGIEPGPIGEIYKRNKLQILSLGLDTWDQHTVKEKMRLTSLPQLTRALERLLVEIPNAPQFPK